MPLPYAAISKDISFQVKARCRRVLEALNLGSLEDCRLAVGSVVTIFPDKTRPDTVVKVMIDKNDGPLMAKEADRLLRLESEGFDIMRTPKLIAHDDGYIWMEKLGPDLEEPWKMFPLPAKELRALGRTLADAQAEFWNKFRFIHNDIKLDHITFEENGRYGLIDFGDVVDGKIEAENLKRFFTRVAVNIHPTLVFPVAERFLKKTGLSFDVESLVKEIATHPLTPDTQIPQFQEILKRREERGKTKRSGADCRAEKRKAAKPKQPKP